MDYSPDSDFDSDSDSDSSIKQEIRRSEPPEKTARKRRVVDKYFRSKKLHIDTKTSKWIW